MKRITLILGVVAVMVAMLVALAAPAMAKDKGDRNGDGVNRLDNQLDRIENRVDNRLDRQDDRFDLDDEVLVSDVGLSPVSVTNEGLADDFCHPGAPDNLFIPGCAFTGDLFANDVVTNGFLVGDLDNGFIRDIDDIDNGFIVDNDHGFFRDVDHANVHNGNGNGNGHNGDGGSAMKHDK